jgi:hypothetical protein
MITQSTDEIRGRIERFVQELDSLVRRQTLDALKAVLAGETAAARPAAKRGRPGRRAATPPAELTAKVLDFVRANDAQTVSQIGVAVGASAKDLRKVLMPLMEQGQVHTTGQRRGTRYHAGAGKKARRKG